MESVCAAPRKAQGKGAADEIPGAQKRRPGRQDSKSCFQAMNLLLLVQATAGPECCSGAGQKRQVQEIKERSLWDSVASGTGCP